MFIIIILLFIVCIFNNEKVKSINSENGNYVRKTVEENNDDELKYSDKKNIFDIIFKFFDKLSEIYIDYLDNSDVNKTNKINELLWIIGVTWFNFDYKEKNFKFNSYSEVANFVANKNKDKNKIEESLNYARDVELMKIISNKKVPNYSIDGNYSSLLYNFDALKRIVKNSNNENFIELSFRENHIVSEHIEFLINYGIIHSVFNKSFIPSNIEIDYFGCYLNENDFYYKHYDKMFELLLYFIIYN
jgi:hypothetical protein